MVPHVSKVFFVQGSLIIRIYGSLGQLGIWVCTTFVTENGLEMLILIIVLLSIKTLKSSMFHSSEPKSKTRDKYVHWRFNSWD